MSPASVFLRRLFILTIAYLVSGRLGLLAPYVGSSITLIWLPTGISLAAVVRWGPQYWPGIALGAFLTNLSVGSSFFVSMGVCAGNTLAPLLSGWLLHRLGFHLDFDRQRDFFAFMLATAVGMLVSATGGVLVLSADGQLSPGMLQTGWLTWWLGDTVGALLMAPLLLSLTRERVRAMHGRYRELAVWAVLLLGVCWGVFFLNRAESGHSYPLVFLTVPLLVWTTLRFGVLGASLAVLLLSVIAACATATGFGPFRQDNPQHGMLLLWAYVATLSLVGMIINALETGRQQVMQKLVESELHLRTIVETEPECVKMLGPRTELLQMNRAGLAIIEADSLKQVEGKVLLGLLVPEHVPPFQELMKKVFSGESAMLAYEIVGLKGAHRWLETHAVPMRDAKGNITALLAVTRDISARRQAEEQVHQLAFYDSLTGLPNRRLLMDRIAHALASCKRDRNYGALLFVDLDHFKTLNDTQGHDAGDLLLTEVAKRLKEQVREEDTVARLGGDEFVVMVEDCNSQEEVAASEAEHVAAKLHAALRRPYSLNGLECFSSCSIGISLFNHEAKPDDLLKRADVAMYQAKHAGRDTIRFFDPAMQAAIEARAALEGDLRRAIERKEFSLHYQPQVDGGRRIVGAEALLRWTHPIRGQVSPAQFIALAEDSGLILPIGAWVMESACRQLKKWETHPRLSEIDLAINVSVRQFRQADFVAETQGILRRTGCKPERLKIELTETMILDNLDDAVAKMQALKRLGVRFSMDDFGTGYSSLAYLKRLPLDQIKIDQSFVRDISSDADDEAIVKAIISIASVMGIEVIAEGVETDAQLLFLAQNGCQAFQGYLFGRPAPLESFETSLSTMG